ncbi:MAG: hypothetical protein GC129_07275 [Proteobacteria bacterium]|nr:hypothetical protein [Pseudomonadota bacterium]
MVRERGISAALQIPLTGVVDGHNVMKDDTVTQALRVDPYVPISPLFARDLCGRFVYLGFGPERKVFADWERYVARKQDGSVDEQVFNPFVTQVAFPRYCRDVAYMPGRELLEDVFFTKFRSVEMSSGFDMLTSGTGEDGDPIAMTFEGANLYPYKLRLDTFYADGWRLPQTQMVFARGEAQGVDTSRAKEMGGEILQKWLSRTPGQAYEEWLMEVGGQAQVEMWFERGVSLIPTFEACNGLQLVGEDFELKDYWPGRAVEGLHEVIEQRASSAPLGTILQVFKPGFVTDRHIEMAQVVVSDGSGYVTSHVNDPVAMIPNLDLPHPRMGDEWGAVWIPTHPEHFEAPALWGWDSASGKFLQMSGPLWDPLHYYYESVDEVLKAFETPMSKTENSWLVQVPEHMRQRFYPVVAMKGFDSYSLVEQSRRIETNILPLSMVKRVPIEKVTAGIGYHPLPVEFEFETDPFWFPELHPLNREHEECPEEIASLIMPVIIPQVNVEEFSKSVESNEDAPWLKSTETLYEAEDEVLDNYPFLSRYLLPDLPLPDVMRFCPVQLLAEREDMLELPPSQWWGDVDKETDLRRWPGMFDTLWDARQKGSDLVKFRHMLYQSNISLYMTGCWYGAPVPLMEEMFTNWMATVQNGEGADIPAQQESDAKRLREATKAAAIIMPPEDLA